MKIIIKNIINENIDPEEKYVNGLSNIINVPYFYNLKVTDTPEHLWDRILTKVFNQEVRVNYDGIYDGIYDSNNNKIYYEDSDGDWDRYEYDLNNNLIYLESSNGYWRKQEYDLNNNEIYYENSDGEIRGNRPNNPINENIDPEEKYVNGLSSILKPPYFYNLKVTETPTYLWNKILSKVFNQEVTLFNNKIYDYSNGNVIYYEDSDGFWEKKEYDSNNNKIYYENSNGYWWKREYDSNNNQIYREDSDGFWAKHEYNDVGNLIYRENSDGEIMDRRPSNTINENIDPEEKYINGIVNMIRRPYMEFLINNEVPEELWKDILSKIFNTNDIFWEIESGDDEVYYELNIRNEKGKLLYYETQNYWDQLIYGYHNRLDMDFTWYVNSVGSKKVAFIGKHSPILYSNGPTGYSWSGLSDDIKNNKFFDPNY